MGRLSGGGGAREKFGNHGGGKKVRVSLRSHAATTTARAAAQRCKRSTLISPRQAGACVSVVAIVARGGWRPGRSGAGATAAHSLGKEVEALRRRRRPVAPVTWLG